jgi:hypothetical protein
MQSLNASTQHQGDIPVAAQHNVEGLLTYKLETSTLYFHFSLSKCETSILKTQISLESRRFRSIAGLFHCHLLHLSSIAFFDMDTSDDRG